MTVGETALKDQQAIRRTDAASARAAAPESDPAAAGFGAPAPARARFSGMRAIAAAAPALFAPAAALAIALAGAADSAAQTITLAAAALGAAPLAAIAAIGLTKPLRGGALALACLPIALAGALAAWLGGGVLSPAGPWIFAALASAAMLGGVRWAAGAAALGLVIGVALLAAPEPPVRLGGFAARGDRELAATLSWVLALVSLASVAWAALASWAEALPPLRHPTIAARRSLAALAETSGVCALRVDSRGRIVQALGAADDTLEMPRRALIGLTLSELAHPDDRDALAALLRREKRARAEPKASEAAEASTGKDGASGHSSGANGVTPLVLRTRSRFGGYRWLEAMAAPASGFPPPPPAPRARTGQTSTPDTDSAASLLAASPDDVMLTLRVRWRSEREIGRGGDAQDAELLAHVNSALRERLKSVVGYTEILKNELFGPIGSPRYRDYARRAHEDGADLLELVDELLDLAEIEAGRYGAQMELLDPVPILDGALRLMSARAERAGVELVADTPPSTPYVRVDRRALRRVLVNMLSDAVRSADMGDKLTLRTRAEEGAIEFQLTATRSAVAGPGFAAIEGEAGASSARADDGSPALLPAPEATATGAAQDLEAEADDNDARLGRMIAANLAERLGGSLVFTVDLHGAPQEPGTERLYAEAILPLGAAPKRDDREAEDDADAGSSRVSLAPSLWGAEDGRVGARRARDEAEERDLDRPLFDFDGPGRKAKARNTPDAPDAEGEGPATPPRLAATGSDD